MTDAQREEVVHELARMIRAELMHLPRPHTARQRVEWLKTAKRRR